MTRARDLADGKFSTDLEVENSSGATFKLTSTDTTGADTELLGQIDFVSSDSSTGSAGTQARIKGVYEDNGDSSGISFLAGASTGSGTPTVSEVMRIRHEGRVGIKTTAPDAALHVLDTSLPQTKIAYDSNRYMNIEHATIYNVSGASQSNSLKIASRGFSGGNDIIFATGGTDAAGSSEAERMKILSGGNVDISAGHLLLDNGYGILFSATGDASGANSELLDDYEEGTWTPSYTQGTSSATYSVQTGRYTKIGNRVFFQFELDGNSITGNTSHLYIGGLPYTASNTQAAAGAQISYSGGVPNDIHVTGVVFANQTNIGIYKYSNGGSVLGNTMALNGGWTWAGHYDV